MKLTGNFIQKNKHVPVLLHEAVNGLDLKKNGIYIDGTFGCGGHTRLILSKLGNKGKLFVIDKDFQSIEIANKIKDSRLSTIHGSFSLIKKYFKEKKIEKKIDGILLDLGISSAQLENPERGFSFMRDGPLDMRMNQTSGISAANWLLKAKENEISYVLKTYGEERFAKRIAFAIKKRNEKKPITRTKELADVIKSAIPLNNKFKHPATRSFQAIRIWINQELKEIKNALKNSVHILAPEGRLSIISFHSKEDRLVKNFIRDQSEIPIFLKKAPITEQQLMILIKPTLKSLSRILPSKKEITQNPRARSAVLRIAKKI